MEMLKETIKEKVLLPINHKWLEFIENLGVAIIKGLKSY